jgi:hypothetical protein
VGAWCRRASGLAVTTYYVTSLVLYCTCDMPCACVQCDINRLDCNSKGDKSGPDLTTLLFVHNSAYPRALIQARACTPFTVSTFTVSTFTVYPMLADDITMDIIYFHMESVSLWPINPFLDPPSFSTLFILSVIWIRCDGKQMRQSRCVNIDEIMG